MSEATNAHLPEHWRQLLALLGRRLQIVADRDWYERDSAGHLRELRDAAAALDAAVAALPADTDPMLRHYLARQSYLKACDWLREALERPVTAQ